MDSNSSILRLRALDELLKMEHDYEVEAYKRSLQEGNISGRANEPDCKYPIAISGAGYNALNQLILTVTYEVDDELENDFEPGQPVAFFYKPTATLDFETGRFSDSDGLKELPFTSFVDSYKEGVIQIQIPGKQALASLQGIAERNMLGIRVAIDDTTYRVMHQALQSVATADNEKVVRLRETLVGNLKPRFHQPSPISFPWLNDVQNRAVRQVVAALDVAVVHGPPGTGKTGGCGAGRGCSPRSSGYGQDDHAGRGRYRDAAARDAGACLRSEQCRCRLDQRAADEARHQRVAHRQSAEDERRDAGVQL